MNQPIIYSSMFVFTMMLMPIAQPLNALISGLLIFVVYTVVNAIGNGWVRKEIHN